MEDVCSLTTGEKMFKGILCIVNAFSEWKMKIKERYFCVVKEKKEFNEKFPAEKFLPKQ